MNRNDLKFLIAKNFNEIISCFNIRAIVFCEEQGIQYFDEFERDEFSSVHILGLLNNEPIATGKMKMINGKMKFERIAVRKKWRRTGVGSALVQFMLEKSNEMGVFNIQFNAQSNVSIFYEKLGFQKKGNPFLEVGIEHILMEKRIQREK